MNDRHVAPPGLVGTRLAARYDVLRQLGAGGSAFVFLARDIRYKRDVAVKVLRQEVAGVVGAERFLREINTLAVLQHPNILPLYDSGVEDDVPFFVTPYVSGLSLRDRLVAEKFLSVDETLRIVREVCDALDYAHGHGIVHRDIKPENVLLQANHALLADFGIARAIDVAAGDQLTSTQIAIGTPAYMSPEQSVGGQRIDASSDVYSLGVLTYEMLAGTVPFTGPTPWAIQARKLIDRVPSLRTIRSTVAPEIETAVTRALSVVPADRFASAGDFAKALMLPKPTSRASSLVRWLGAAAIVCMLAVGALFAWQRSRHQVGVTAAPRVVVGEFSNLTGDPSFDYLGITAVDWLTEGLQRTGVVSGVPTESAVQASRFVAERKRGTTDDPVLDLAHESNADIVVSGRIYRSHDSLQYQIQVTDAKSHALLGAIGPIATPVGDPIRGLVSANGRLMGLLATRVDERLGKFVNGLPAPPTYEAYKKFSLGFDRYVQSDFGAAATLFTAAYALDTTFEAPLLFASISLSNQGMYREADSLLDKLSDRRGELTHLQQAWLDYRRAFLAGQRRAALSAARTLDSLDPGSKATYNHAIEALENGYVEEALATLLGLSPERGQMRGWIPYFEVLGTAYHLVGRFSDELAVGEEARRRYPDRRYALLPSVRALAALDRVPALKQVLARAATMPSDPYGTTTEQLFLQAGDELHAHGDTARARDFYLEALRSVGKSASGQLKRQDASIKEAAQRGLGDWGGAAETAKRLVQIDSTDPDSRGFLGTALARTGNISEARRILNDLGNDRRPYLFGGPALAQARIATALGDRDAAITDLARGFAEGWEFDLWVHRDPDFDSLRSLPRFQTLVALKR